MGMMMLRIARVPAMSPRMMMQVIPGLAPTGAGVRHGSYRGTSMNDLLFLRPQQHTCAELPLGTPPSSTAPVSFFFFFVDRCVHGLVHADDEVELASHPAGASVR
jgi:hypothetical protein